MSDVFIIDASCSVPYGFPTGTMLMQNLKNFDYGRKFPRKNYSDGDIFLVDYIRGYETVTECRQGLEAYLARYNDVRLHSSLDRNTPSDVYFKKVRLDKVA